MIINGDSLHELKNLEDKSVDAVITDPPYGYSFMGKDWDKAVPSVEIWRECLRVLKPGGWCMVMSAPRSDVQNAMISRLMEAGFRLDFTPIYWTYASGFPKAGNVGKLVDKRAGAAREVTGYVNTAPDGLIRKPALKSSHDGVKIGNAGSEFNGFGAPITAPATDQAKALDGSYTGFQPKPAVEVVIVAMKPLSEKTYVDQALKNGKGITWLDDCRVPTGDSLNGGAYQDKEGKTGAGEAYEGGFKYLNNEFVQPQGRFPANLLVSDDALNGHSKYFDLDAWADTLPFLAVPKASKSEKNKGLESFEDSDGSKRTRSDIMSKNHHPTVKPLKLMSYLITLTTREGDTVLDPFVGSGTTVVAAKQLGRKGVGIEREEEYAEIARARVEAVNEAEEQLSLV